MKQRLIAIVLVGSLTATTAWCATPSNSEPASEPATQLEKILVTGSLASPDTEAVKLEKFMVTGSLAAPAGETVALEKFMVTGSLAAEPGDAVKLEKFMVTGSREATPALRLRHQR